jgi:hypothetical protein
LSIPLSGHIDDDFVARNKTKSCSFSVRSAYYSEWDHQFGSRVRRTDGRGTAEINPVWNNIWKLKVPGKVQIFIWRALHGALPGRAILANRHVMVSGQCPIYQAGAEDIRHIMFTCGRARAVWKALGLRDYIDKCVIGERSRS